jgi:tetratricopeptide (TPR) repeat protein
MLRHVCLSWQVVLFIGLLGARAFAQTQELDAVGESINLSARTGSIPVWQQAASQATADLQDCVNHRAPAVLLVGNQHGYGTAFVISKQARLLATNAHVADILHETGSMVAIRNQSSDVYKVEKVWYHPGVRRMSNGHFSIRSIDPADGPVDPNSPDVAVLRLAPGPDLPDEFELAPRQELGQLLARTVGMLGFPGHDTTSWPALGQRAEATFRTGVICRLSDFSNSVDGPGYTMQSVQHSLASWFGFSGSPIFDSAGRVVAIHNCAKTESANERQISIPYGVRIDCLWELLVHHDLDRQVRINNDRAAIEQQLERYRAPDRESEKSRQIVILMQEANSLKGREHLTEAVHLYNQVLEVAPTYADAIRGRGLSYDQYALLVAQDPDARRKYYNLALEDERTYLRLNPSDPLGYLVFCGTLINLGALDGRQERRDLILGIANKLIESPNTPKDVKATAYVRRALVRSFDKVANLFRDEILGDLVQALRLDPFNMPAYFARAQLTASAADYARVEELKEAIRANSEAWILATHSDKSKRDGRKAFELAGRACQITDYKYWKYLDTLAAAYAELSDFEHAQKYERMTVELAPDVMKPQCLTQLRSYESLAAKQ